MTQGVKGRRGILYRIRVPAVRAVALPAIAAPVRPPPAVHPVTHSGTPGTPGPAPASGTNGAALHARPAAAPRQNLVHDGAEPAARLGRTSSAPRQNLIRDWAELFTPVTMADEYMEKVRALIADNAPELHLHAEEAFLPCSAEWFLRHCSLWYVEPPNRKDKVRRLTVLLFSLSTAHPRHPTRVTWVARVG
jgi:hypothetical protein